MSVAHLQNDVKVMWTWSNKSGGSDVTGRHAGWLTHLSLLRRDDEVMHLFPRLVPAALFVSQAARSIEGFVAHERAALYRRSD